MRESSTSVVVDMAPEALWDYLADYQNPIRLASASAVAEIIDGVALTEGATYRARLSWEGLGAEWDSWLAVAERPRRLRWESDSHGGTCFLDFQLTPYKERQTELTVTLSYEAAKSQTPLEPFAWGLLGRYLDRCIKGFGRLHQAV